MSIASLARYFFKTFADLELLFPFLSILAFTRSLVSLRSFVVIFFFTTFLPNGEDIMLMFTGRRADFYGEGVLSTAGDLDLDTDF